MLTTWLIYLCTGAAAGLMAGLFGVGGGMIMVPALAWVLPTQGVPEGQLMQVAVATSLGVISATSISSAWTHHRHGGVLWSVFQRMTPGLVAGSVGGAFVAHLLPSDTLRQFVAIGALLTALKMFLERESRGHARLPTALNLFGAGGVIGVLSSLIGIGGGSLTVPYLTWFSVPIRQAVGTAAACGVPIAWAGTIGFILAGWKVDGLPQDHLGYVSLLGVVGIGLASVAAAPLGARLAHRLPPRLLKQAFAVLLTGIGIHMLLT